MIGGIILDPAIVIGIVSLGVSFLIGLWNIKINIENHVDFVGSVNQSELVPYYQKAQLLLLPSAHESFGMVMVEAMACGTPVAALSGAGGPDEIVVNGENGILATKENFSEKVLIYLKSETQQEKFQKQARLNV